MSGVIITVIGALIIFALVELWSRSWLSRFISRALRLQGSGPRRLEPECRFIVRLSESEVVCDRPDGKIERVAWSDLQKVEVVTTDDGPHLPDVFFVLHGTNGGCAIPQGATGENDLLDRLLALPGFNNKAFIDSMSCAENRRFLCWQKAA